MRGIPDGRKSRLGATLVIASGSVEVVEAKEGPALELLLSLEVGFRMILGYAVCFSGIDPSGATEDDGRFGSVETVDSPSGRTGTPASGG